ncbi:MAG TPA: M28 family peptidase [Candidatus Hydrogenedentes bacterium]|nr:M28 family peptidase [Candidatus Hydrogenedentota bacterium]HOS02757.1 M28 family peptidase [Candidatus Hydrogenedentota bacterium]
MREAIIQKDLLHLAGVLPHRGANTEREREAAEYLQRRLRESLADVEIDSFRSVGDSLRVAAAYYGEFAFVAVLAHWFPYAAFTYGLAVFMAYLAELAGYGLSAKLLAQFDTQNVVGRLLGIRPRRLVILTAHYDSPKSTVLARPCAWRQARWMHLGLVVSMAAVLISCLTQGSGLFEEDGFRMDFFVRWTAVAALVCMALHLFFQARTEDYLLGANDNASGVAALLDVADRLAAAPPEQLDVWFVATGASEGWMSGMRRLFQTHAFERRETFFINLDRVGGETPVIVSGEGLLHGFHASRRLIAMAKHSGAAYGAIHRKRADMPSEAIVPLARGFEAITLSSDGQHDNASLDDLAEETFRSVNPATVAATAAIAAGIIRKLEATACDRA